MLNEGKDETMRTRIVNIFMLIFFSATFISKTIEEPILINISLADILWPIMALVFMLKLFVSSDFREGLLLEKKMWIVGSLFILGILSSLHGYMTIPPVQISRLEYGKSLIVSSTKNVLILGYFLSGWMLTRRISEKKIVITGVCIAIVFSVIGIFSMVTGIPDWAIDRGRLLSTVNDPNVAGLICLTGLLFLWKLLEVPFSNVYLKIIILTLGTPTLIATIFLTSSRTSLLGLSILVCLFIIYYRKSYKLLLVVFTTLLLFISGLYYMDNTRFQGENYSYLINRFLNGTERAYDFRDDLRESALMMGMDHYCIGVGVGQFSNFSTSYYETLGYDVKTNHFEEIVSPKVPHNTYLTYFAERGILGFILFTALLMYSFVMSKGLISKSYLMVISLFSLFFNIESIRVVWFLWGGIAVFYTRVEAGVKGVQQENFCNENSWMIKYSFRISIILIMTSILSIGVFIKTLLHMYVPYTALTSQCIEINVEDNKLELQLEFSVGINEPIFIEFEGENNYKSIIRNSYGFYKNTFDLPSGVYRMTLSSGTGKVNFQKGIISTGDHRCFLYNSLLNGGLTTRQLTDFDIDRMKKIDIPINISRVFEEVQNKQLNSVFLNQENGINFEDIIELESMILSTLEDKHQYEMVFEFKKIGKIEKPLMLVVGGYDLQDSRNGKSKNIEETISFEPALTDIEVGELFKGVWTINTGGRPYMLQYSFYYKDPETKEVTQPFPKWIYDGYVH